MRTVLIALMAFTMWSAIVERTMVTLPIPEYFPRATYNFSQNPLNKETIELGRMLFYEPQLSKDNTISCASCHSPYNAFAHVDHALSHGVEDQVGRRNAPALFNLAWQKTFMWDGAVHHLDVQALAPITHPKEMGLSMNALVDKLNAHSLYPSLFEKAFGEKEITGEHILKALSQFQLTLVSTNSKYDQVQRGDAFFTEQELNGQRLFDENCNHCHTAPLFSNQEFERNQLSLDPYLQDLGRQEITGLSADSMRFKVPSLRNLDYTFPYMHDGRFKKLSEVIVFYTKSNLLDKKEWTENEKRDLLAFLITLNDPSFVFDKSHHYQKNSFDEN
jgi:cytochrome c peroxidase